MITKKNKYLRITYNQMVTLFANSKIKEESLSEFIDYKIKWYNECGISVYYQDEIFIWKTYPAIRHITPKEYNIYLPNTETKTQNFEYQTRTEAKLFATTKGFNFKDACINYFAELYLKSRNEIIDMDLEFNFNSEKLTYNKLTLHFSLENAKKETHVL